MHHSSLREVDLLSLGEGQECRANTNGHRILSDVFSWHRGCIGQESTTTQYVVHSENTVYIYICNLFTWVPSTILPP